MKALKKLVMLLMIFLTVACEQQKPKRVWLFDDDEVTLLNGNVKQITVGIDGPAAKFFYRAYFDDHDSQMHSEKRTLDTSEFMNIFHLERDTTTVQYSMQIGRNGILEATTGKYIGNNKSISTWSFGKNGRVTTRCIKDSNQPCFTVGYYKYNANGDLIELMRILSGGNADPDVYKYKYDRNHHMIEEDLYEDILLTKTYIEYKSFDSNGNWLIEISHTKYAHSPSTTDTIIRKITYY